MNVVVVVFYFLFVFHEISDDLEVNMNLDKEIIL